MKRRLGLTLLGALVSAGCLMPAEAWETGRLHNVHRSKLVAFSATTGDYVISFRSSNGAILIRPRGKSAELVIRELPGGKKLDLLYSASSVRRSSSSYVVRGAASWASFTFEVGTRPHYPGLLHFRLTLTRRRSLPEMQSLIPDIRLVHASPRSIKEYAAAPPVAGSSLFLSSRSLGSSLLYLADFTTLGSFFDRTGSGATQGVFSYPNAGDRGALIGLGSSGYFGYVEPPGSLENVPRGKATIVVDSYLYLLPTVPNEEAGVADMYLKLLGTVYGVLPHPALPTPNWADLASKEASDLSDASNWVTVGGKRFLRSYVSDTRSAPELITQAGVLVGVKAYEARFHQQLPLDATLERTLPAFYDSQFHTIVNGLPHDPDVTGESWYFVQNMISLLQLAQLGSQTAKELLLDSVDAVMAFAHASNYEFPQTFHYRGWTGQGSGVQADAAGGYAWLMLGLYDLTGESRYLDEARASIAHAAGKGFSLAYETQMTAYTAAAAERLYGMSGDAVYQSYARLALANLFHATRLWDCTYGLCRKGSGYHTYFGLNPLPWSDYIAMLEQYQAWLGLRDYTKYAKDEPTYVRGLVDGFLANSPLILQYSLPPSLPAGAASPTAGEYPFVPRNNLGWHIPLEDLREGDTTSGEIGQEIYGAGGPFIFSAYG